MRFLDAMLTDLNYLDTSDEQKKVYITPDIKMKLEDNRSYIDKDGWHVYPAYISQNRVSIVCPYCGLLHYHGNNNNDYQGHRVAHCDNPDNRGYYIEQIEDLNRNAD